MSSIAVKNILIGFFESASRANGNSRAESVSDESSDDLVIEARLLSVLARCVGLVDYQPVRIVNCTRWMWIRVIGLRAAYVHRIAVFLPLECAGAWLFSTVGYLWRRVGRGVWGLRAGVRFHILEPVVTKLAPSSRFNPAPSSALHCRPYYGRFQFFLHRL